MGFNDKRAKYKTLAGFIGLQRRLQEYNMSRRSRRNLHKPAVAAPHRFQVPFGRSRRRRSDGRSSDAPLNLTATTHNIRRNATALPLSMYMRVYAPRDVQDTLILLSSQALLGDVGLEDVMCVYMVSGPLSILEEYPQGNAVPRQLLGSMLSVIASLCQVSGLSRPSTCRRR